MAEAWQADGTHGELLALFRALADPTRLAIVSQLLDGERVVGEIAQALTVSAATASHHLRRLQAVGLVTCAADGPFRRYRLDTARLTDLSRRLASGAALRQAVRPKEPAARVLHQFVREGRIVAIPAQRRKRAVVIDWLADHFAPDRRYTEREVNETIRPLAEDVATLRRELVAFGHLARQDGVYWRVTRSEAARA